MAHEQTITPDLPVGSVDRRAAGWWGVMTLIGTEGALFAYLFFSYYYLASKSPWPWPPSGLPEFTYSAPNTAALAVSVLAVAGGQWAMTRGRRLLCLAGLLIAICLGALFVALQVLEWKAQQFSWSTDAYGSLYYTITALHVLHLLAGLMVLLGLLVAVAIGALGRQRNAALTIGAAYWYFVFAVWVVEFLVLYVSPYLSGL